MRVISIGLDPNVGDTTKISHAVAWVREMARHVVEYIEIGPSADGRSTGPIRLAENATSWLIDGSPLTYSWRAARLAERLHAEQPFDVITTEDPVRAGLAGLLCARRTGIPLNVENHSFHINEPIWLQEKFHYRIFNRVAIAVCRRADSIRNYSGGQTRALLDIGVDPSRIRTIPINAPDFSPVEEDVARRMIGVGPDPFVLCVGRMVAYKNIPLLLSAFKGVTSPRNAKLLLVGDGRAKVGWQRMATSMGLDDRVIWRDSVPFGAMPAYYSAASAFAAPALHETGPRTVFEALLCGCPVVLTPEMGVVRSGVCIDGESALVVRPGDVGGWTRALEALLADKSWGRQLAAAGRRRIGQEFSFASIAKQVVQLLEDTVRHSGRGESRELCS